MNFYEQIICKGWLEREREINGKKIKNVSQKNLKTDPPMVSARKGNEFVHFCE